MRCGFPIWSSRAKKTKRPLFKQIYCLNKRFISACLWRGTNRDYLTNKTIGRNDASQRRAESTRSFLCCQALLKSGSRQKQAGKHVAASRKWRDDAWFPHCGWCSVGLSLSDMWCHWRRRSGKSKPGTPSERGCPAAWVRLMTEFSPFSYLWADRFGAALGFVSGLWE